MGERLTHLGWLDRRELGKAIDRSSFGMLTYADTAPYAVGSPTKAFEFAAGGLPVIATPNKMNQQLLAKNGAGFLAAGFDTMSLRDAIVAALADAEAWKRASDAGRVWALEDGSWNQSEKRLIDVYRDVLGIGTP